MNTPAGVCSVQFALTARNGLDISAAQLNTSSINGKIGNAVGLKSLSVIRTVSVTGGHGDCVVRYFDSCHLIHQLLLTDYILLLKSKISILSFFNKVPFYGHDRLS
jgi:hypothetical protein